MNAILDKVFNRFDTLIKMLTNQGMKFHEEFQDLCEKALINHHMISWDHFEVDMLIEQMVQTMKLCVHIDFVGCDYMMCYFASVENVTFWNVVVGGLRW